VAARDRDIRLGRLELDIMKAVWDRNGATVREVQEALSSRARAYSTILTMMRKLEAKGYLRHEERDRTFTYRAIVTRAQVRKSLLADLVDRVFDGSAELVVNGLVEHRRLSRAELDEIRKALDERRGKE
jgi:BlaI family penicillinase repressor